MKYKLAVYIGRFQPFHLGHRYVIDEALKIADKVLVLVGSANASRSTKNPFTYEEVEQHIKSCYALSNIVVEPLNDYTYEEGQWLTEVQELVELYADSSNEVTLIGYDKDESSYYLKHFPQYFLTTVNYFDNINATQIRELYFKGVFRYMQSALPINVYNSLVDFAKSMEYNNLLNEWKYVENYKKSWSSSPYEPIFVTVDSVVIQSGHILLIKRGGMPGKGLWALPGGFIGSSERLKESCIRELREETKLKVPEPVLKGSIKKMETFDAPERSTRGRTITQAFLIKLDDAQSLPKVKGSDDAEYAKWIPLADFYTMATDMYEDHYHIVRKLIDNE